MSFKNFSKIALCSAGLLASASPVFAESKVELSGKVRTSIDYKDHQGSRPMLTHEGFGGRLEAASKRMGGDALWGSGKISVEAATGGGVSTHEAYLKFGGEMWDLTAGRFLVAKFTDLSGTNYDGFFMSKNGGLAYATNYEAYTISGLTGNDMAFHLMPNENVNFELTFHSAASSAVTGGAPATQDYGFRPHLGLTFGNIKVAAVVEWLTKDDNDATTTGASNHYKTDSLGGGLAASVGVDALSFGLSFATYQMDGKTRTNSTMNETDKQTYSGNLYYNLTESSKVGLVLAYTDAKMTAKETGSTTVDEKDFGWLVHAGFGVAEGTDLDLGYSGSSGEHKMSGKTHDLDSNQVKVQLTYNF